MVQGDLRAFIVALPAVVTARAQVYWGQCPDPRAMPYIVLMEIAGQIVTCHGGGTNLASLWMQADCVANTEATAITMRDAINTALNGTRQTIGSTYIRSAIQQNNRGQFDGGPNFFVARTDLIIQYQPTA